LLRIIVHTFQYSHIVYLSHIVSYDFQNKCVVVSDTCHIWYTYCICAS